MIRKTFLALLLSGGLLAADLKFLWNKNPEPTIAYYILYYGGKSGVYNKSVTTTDIWTVIRRFPVGYYYACVVAVDDKGQKSPPSDEIEFKVGKKSVTTIPNFLLLV